MQNTDDSGFFYIMLCSCLYSVLVPLCCNGLVMEHTGTVLKVRAKFTKNLFFWCKRMKRHLTVFTEVSRLPNDRKAAPLKTVCVGVPMEARKTFGSREWPFH